MREPVVGVLGRTEVVDGGRAPSVRQRRLLAGLVAAGETGATIARLTGLVWPEGPPATARASMQNQVARLRARLGDEAIQWRDDDRYVLDTARVPTDVAVLQDWRAALHDAREATASHRLTLCSAALALVRGIPYADLGDDGAGRARQRAIEVVADVRAARVQALSQLGRHDEAVAEQRDLVAADPLHEGRQAALLDTLRRAGRRTEAVDAYRRTRRLLVDEFGMGPGRLLDDAYRAVVEQKPVPGRSLGTAAIPRPRVAQVLADLLAEGGLVVAHGPPGLGKTALVRQLHDPRPSGQVVVVDAADARWTALQPLDALLVRLATLAGPGTVRPRSVAELVATGHDRRRPGGDGFGLVHAVAAAVRHVARDVPLTLVVDDVHRAGPTTRRVLAALVDDPRVRLLAVTSRDPDELAFATPLRTWRVPAFEEDETALLVEAHLRRRHGLDDVVAWVHAASGGHPMHALELLEELRRSHALHRREDGSLTVETPLELPPRLLELAAARIATLGRRVRRSLDVLAVTGDGSGTALLTAVGADRRALDVAAGGGLVTVDDDRWRWRHDVLRRAALDQVPAGLQVEIAIAAADVLALEGASAARVAPLRLHAVDVDPHAAACSCLGAAEEAAGELAFAEAVDWADRGLAALDESSASWPALRAALAVVGADARRRGGIVGHADALLAAARDALGVADPALRRSAVLATLRLGECCQPGEAQRAAVRLAGAALAAEPPGDPMGRAAILASLSLTTSMVDAEASRTHLADALALLDAHRAGEASREEHARLEVEVLPYVYLGLATPDVAAARAAATERLAAAAETLDDDEARFEAEHLRFSVAVQRGDVGGMARALARQEALAPVAADAGRRWEVAYQRAALAQARGELDACERAAAEALELGRTVAAERATATWAGQLLELRRQQGRLAELRPLLDDFVADADAMPAWRVAAAMVLAAGDPGAAAPLVAELAADLTALPHDFSLGGVTITLARAVLAVGDPTAAAAVHDLLAPWRDQWSWQGTTTYGPFAPIVDALASLVRAASRP